MDVRESSARFLYAVGGPTEVTGQGGQRTHGAEPRVALGVLTNTAGCHYIRWHVQPRGASLGGRQTQPDSDHVPEHVPFLLQQSTPQADDKPAVSQPELYIGVVNI